MQSAILSSCMWRGALHTSRSLRAATWRTAEALRTQSRGIIPHNIRRLSGVRRLQAEVQTGSSGTPPLEEQTRYDGILSAREIAGASIEAEEDSEHAPLEEIGPVVDDMTVVLHARQLYGDILPAGLLNDAQLEIFTRLYDAPDIVSREETGERMQLEAERAEVGTNVLREDEDGELHEIVYTSEATEEEATPGELSLEDLLNTKAFRRLQKSKKGKFFAKATKKELDSKFLFREISVPELKALDHLDAEWEAMDEETTAMYLDDIRYFKLEHYFREGDRDTDANEMIQCLHIFREAQAELLLETDEINGADHEIHDPMIEMSSTSEDMEDADVNGHVEEEVDEHRRFHPLTLESRFGTSPSTIHLPQNEMVRPTNVIISGSPAVHLAQAAERLFGGVGLPYSTQNPAFAKSLPQKPIPVDPSQERMSEIEADAYFAAVMPGSYASISSVLVETRKRLGSSWVEDMLSKDGGPRILDAGAAGAGVLAVRSLLRAEWERLHDDSDDPDAATAMTTPDGREGGAPAEPPLGRATVLTASAVLRRRASVLLEDTTFVPRLPDYVHATNATAAQQGKFDIIIASHALWPIKEDYMRKAYVSNMWSLLNADGGVLILVEKGVPRGFEVIGAARKYLLDKRISSPGQELVATNLEEQSDPETYGVRTKERGMIIAPCTNHSTCPMYTRTGISIGRQDFCHFKQRYIRPPYLQKLLGARDKNHEDVDFSYLSVMRGRDLRDPSELGIIQGPEATERAFAGYESDQAAQTPIFDPTAPALESIDDDDGRRTGVHPLSLPRTILTPLKRTGHVIMDLCTPSGTFERWIVARSQSRQAYHDARKSSWGDLWALGAKTRLPRVARLGKANALHKAVDLKKVTVSRRAAKQYRQHGLPKSVADAVKGKNRGTEVYEMPVDLEGGKIGEDFKVRSRGRMRTGKKIGGIRDKRPRAGARNPKRNRDED